MISVHFQPEPFSITVIQVYAPTTNAKEAEVGWFYKDLQDLLELTHSHTKKKDVLFIIGEKNAKVGSQEISRVTGKIWTRSTKLSRAKANRVLPREPMGHTKHPLPTTQEMTLYMDITRWAVTKSD